MGIFNLLIADAIIVGTGTNMCVDAVKQIDGSARDLYYEYIDGTYMAIDDAIDSLNNAPLTTADDAIDCYDWEDSYQSDAALLNSLLSGGAR